MPLLVCYAGVSTTSRLANLTRLRLSLDHRAFVHPPNPDAAPGGPARAWHLTEQVADHSQLATIRASTGYPPKQPEGEGQEPRPRIHARGTE